MKKILSTLFLALMVSIPAMAELADGGEYYIWLNIYEKLLGNNEAGDGPALSAYNVNTDGYVFVAEKSGKSGYMLLRQKSSGKYLAASGSNNWSVTLESKQTADRFCWQLDEGCYTYIVNKKNGKYLGIDGGKKGASYVSVYYDKRKSSHAQYSVIPAVGSWDEARQAYESGDYENAQGVNEDDFCQLNNRHIDRSDEVDLHITSNDNPILGTTSVNLGSDRTWLIFDNIVPSEVINNWLQYVTISGAPAVNGENCRVAIYLNGAAVIPLPQVAMSCDGTSGAFSLEVGNHSNLAEMWQSNTMTSFTLRRGYMATLANGSDGSWYSRVYVADHHDLEVTLPNALAKRVTSVNIKPWQYVSKKGWADTKGPSRGPQLRATWFWSWSAGYNSTADMEYVPCRQHRYWPSVNEINNKTQTAAFSINEPEHSEQHTSSQCTCGGTLNAWTTYGLNKDFQAGGGRIGSPQPQSDDDFSYLEDFFGYIDNNNNYSRCDFATIHDYLDVGTRDADTYAKYVTDTYWKLWNSVKRPIWITEMEVGASWHNQSKSTINSYDKAREYLQALLQRLEESDYIERYAIYAFDYWRNYMFYDDGWITPAGEVYRDHRSTFAYNSKNDKVPAWWADSAKKPELTACEVDGNDAKFTISNTNGDATDQIIIEHKPVGGSWQQLYVFEGNRSLLEGSTLTVKLPLDEIDPLGDTFRVVATTLYGGSETSNELAGPVLAETVEVTPIEYATYVSTRDLDFTDTRIMAFTATVSGRDVVLTPINRVPAGTPVVLYCEGGLTENIPVATATDPVGDNELMPGTGKAVPTDGDGDCKNYILNNVSGIGFYRAAGQVVAKNRAYLSVQNAANSRLNIVFANSTPVPSIVAQPQVPSVVALPQPTSTLHDLQGRKVTSPTPRKGLYISNGKKVTVK